MKIWISWACLKSMLTPITSSSSVVYLSTCLYLSIVFLSTCLAPLISPSTKPKSLAANQLTNGLKEKMKDLWKLRTIESNWVFVNIMIYQSRNISCPHSTIERLDFWVLWQITVISVVTELTVICQWEWMFRTGSSWVLDQGF